MKTKEIVILVDALLSGTVQAEREFVAKSADNDTISYADPATIRRNGNKIKMEVSC